MARIFGQNMSALEKKNACIIKVSHDHLKDFRSINEICKRWHNWFLQLYLVPACTHNAHDIQTYLLVHSETCKHAETRPVAGGGPQEKILRLKTVLRTYLPLTSLATGLAETSSKVHFTWTSIVSTKTSINLSAIVYSCKKMKFFTIYQYSLLIFSYLSIKI